MNIPILSCLSVSAHMFSVYLIQHTNPVPMPSDLSLAQPSSWLKSAIICIRARTAPSKARRFARTALSSALTTTDSKNWSIGPIKRPKPVSRRGFPFHPGPPQPAERQQRLMQICFCRIGKQLYVCLIRVNSAFFLFSGEDREARRQPPASRAPSFVFKNPSRAVARRIQRRKSPTAPAGAIAKAAATTS